MSLMACSDDEEENVVSTISYKLPEGCDWKDVPLKEKTLYRIDSMEEFESLNLTDCDGIDIDFEKYTLLYHRFATGAVEAITTKLYRTEESPNQYYLKTIIYKYKGNKPVPAIMHIQHVALIVNKLDRDASVELSVVEK